MKSKLMLLCSLVLLNSYIQSQTEDSLNQRQVNMSEVVVSTSKFEGLRSNAAQQAHVLTNTELKRMNAQTTGDALQMTGQVFVQKSQQGGGSPILRGFEASRVLLVVDGVRMNNIQYRAGHLQNVITVDNNVLDRIEVLFGPSSTVYGSDALGGVVHMRTRNPYLATDKNFLSKGSALFRYGSVNNELTGHVDVSLGGKKLASLTSATFSRFGNLRQGNYTNRETAGMWNRDFFQSLAPQFDSLGKLEQLNDTAIANPNPDVQIGTEYWQYDLLQKFLFQQRENISHTLNIQFSNSSNIPRYDRLAVTSGSTVLRDGDWYYGPQQRLLVAYSFLWKNLGPLDAVSIGLNYQNIKESRNNRGFGKRFRTERSERVDVVGLTIDFRKKVKEHDLSFGLDGQFNLLKSAAVARDVHEDTTTAASTRYPDGKNSMNYIGLYVTHQWAITPKIILSDGLRYNFVGLKSTLTPESQEFFPLPYNEIKNNHHAVSGNVGLVFKPGLGFRVVVLGSTGFRAPNVDDLAKIFESVPGTVIVPNEKLKPEYTINGELTVEKTFAERYRLSVTGFYTYFINAIVADQFTYNGEDSIDFDGVLSRVIANQNKAKAYIAGVSAMAEADVTHWMSLYASVNYTHGRIITDTVPYPLDHVAPVYGRAGLRAHHKWIRGEFFAVFSGKKKVKDYNLLGEDNFGQATPSGMPAWYTLNLRIGFTPIKHFTIDLGCDNLMDLRYRHFASGISAPGRNFFVAARVNW